MKLSKQFRRMAHIKCQHCDAVLVSFLVRAKMAREMLRYQDGQAVMDLVIDKAPLTRTMRKVRLDLERSVAAHHCRGEAVPA